MDAVKRFTTIILVFSTLGISQTFAKPRKNHLANKHKRNRVKWAEVITSGISTQIMFGFDQPIYFKKKINKEKSQLLIQFDVKKKLFNSSHVITQISRLKNSGVIKSVSIYEKSGGTVLALTFPKNRVVNVGNKREKRKNKLLIKWSKLKNPHRLIIDIFTTDALDNIRRRNNVIQQAHNTSSRPFFFAAKRGKRPYRRKPRVIIDAGHGGNDLGAKGSHGIYEKNITLQIAKRVRNILRHNGISALLTRSTDDYVSPLTRSELAEQMHADLFVSVHVNSHGNPKQNPHGIETLYLDKSKFIPSKGNNNTGFWHLNTSPSSRMVKKVKDILLTNNKMSAKFAYNLQKNLIAQLKKQAYKPRNRGLKKSREKVLMRSSIPAALVEVGFITHKQELQNLISPDYQQIIAQGIYSGIKKTLISLK